MAKSSKRIGDHKGVYEAYHLPIRARQYLVEHSWPIRYRLCLRGTPSWLPAVASPWWPLQNGRHDDVFERAVPIRIDILTRDEFCL